MPKRQYGVGSIYQEASGRWCGALIVDGRRIKVTGERRSEVVKKLSEMRQEVPGEPLVANSDSRTANSTLVWG